MSGVGIREAKPTEMYDKYRRQKNHQSASPKYRNIHVVQENSASFILGPGKTMSVQSD